MKIEPSYWLIGQPCVPTSNNVSRRVVTPWRMNGRLQFMIIEIDTQLPGTYDLSYVL